MGNNNEDILIIINDILKQIDNIIKTYKEKEKELSAIKKVIEDLKKIHKTTNSIKEIFANDKEKLNYLSLQLKDIKDKIFLQIVNETIESIKSNLPNDLYLENSSEVNNVSIIKNKDSKSIGEIRIVNEGKKIEVSLIDSNKAEFESNQIYSVTSFIINKYFYDESFR